jgi:hypothetical protein
MLFSRRQHAWGLCLLLSLAAAACAESDFPVTPTPTAQTPLVTQQTASYQGSIVGGAGQVAFFNMTLIARSLGATLALAAQAPGTTVVSGLFETGTGIEGTIEGIVEGALHDGTVRLTLAVVHDGCTEQRIYTGVVTGSGVALAPGEWLQSCPANVLTFAVQASIPMSPACTYSVSPTSLTMSGNGGTGTVGVTTATGCPWVAEAVVPWLSVTGAPTVSGSGTIVLLAQVNDGALRTGTARVAGQAIVVTQGPQCSIAIAPTSARLPAAGGSSTVAVTAPEGCSWSAQSNEPWLTVAPLSGQGSASVQVVAAPNGSTQRQGTVVIGGQSLTVVQDAAITPCVFAIAPTTARLPAAGGTTAVAVTAPAGCSWSADTSEPWLTVTPRSGQGSASMQVVAAANGGTQRQGTVVIGGQSFTVVQDAAATPTPCAFAIAPTAASIGTFGGKGTVAVTAGAGCSWSVNPGTATWLQVSPLSGTGNGTVAYSAGSNLGPARSATIIIAGQPFMVSQAGNVVTISVNINSTVPIGYTRSAGTVETTTFGKPDGRIRCSRFVDQPQTGTCSATFTITAPTQVTFLATPDPDYPGTQIQWDTCGAARECSLSINDGGTYKPMEVRLIRPILF